MSRVLRDVGDVTAHNTRHLLVVTAVSDSYLSFVSTGGVFR